MPEPTRGRSALEEVELALDAIARVDARTRAVITAVPEQALAAARRCDDAAARGEWLGVLHGMTVSVKDNIDTADVLTTYGSAFFADHVPTADATVVRLLRAAGAVVVAKVNLAEFAFGGTTQNPHHGACRNPWDTDRIPGGSSGGSGVAVAAGMGIGSLGTDTGGSVRIPASFNGVCGLRPTLGRISNRGTMPVSSRFDTVGPLARRVVDVARLFTALDVYDPRDATSHRGDRRDVLQALTAGVAGVRVGVPVNFFFDDVDPEVDAAVRAAADVLRDLGAEFVPVTLPGAEQAQERMTKMIYPDAAAVHAARLRTAPERFGEDVRRRLELGLSTTATDSAAATAWRVGFQRQVDGLFEVVDVVLSPTVPMAAPPAASAEMVATTSAVTRLTYAWSMANGPSLSVPCGFHAAGLPIGLHLAGPAWREDVLFRVGAAYQRCTDWHLRTPPLAQDVAQASAR